MFYNILDLADISAWILYKETKEVSISQKNFIFQLAEELDSDLRDKPHTSFSSLSYARNPNMRKSCQFGLCKENRCSNGCINCNKYACKKCTAKIPDMHNHSVFAITCMLCAKVKAFVRVCLSLGFINIL